MTRRRKRTVTLLKLPVGATFEIPGTGRRGQVLSPPSISSAYCRIYRLADETVDEDGKKAKKYDDITISSGIEVIVLTLPDTDAAPARPAPR